MVGKLLAQPILRSHSKDIRHQSHRSTYVALSGSDTIALQSLAWRSRNKIVAKSQGFDWLQCAIIPARVVADEWIRTL
jgi:hypothetical protein